MPGTNASHVLIDGKGGGEKTAIKQVLKAELDLTGKIVIADALHTDREIRAIEKNASYVLTIKGDQKSLRKQLVRLFTVAQERCPELLCCFTTLDKGHGRLEERTIQVLGTHNSELYIPGILQAARGTRTREILKSGKKSKEEIFLITNGISSQADAQTLLALKRLYWAIENKLHYRKDFVFGEDKSTIRAR